MVMFCKHPKLPDYDLSSVEIIICGAAPLSEKVEEVVRKRLSIKNIHQGQYKQPFLKTSVHNNIPSSKGTIVM